MMGDIFYFLFVIQEICLLSFIFFYSRDQAKERKQLYDRLQASDLREYKLLSEPHEATKKQEKKERYDFV